MTAQPARRKRRTITAAVVAIALVLAAVALTAFGATAVVNSTEGEAVVGETRDVISLPVTDNAALAVVDGNNQLTSLIVATLLPAGIGGSIVTIPVNADASIGFGEDRRPLDAQLDVTAPESFFQEVEASLSLSLQFGEIVTESRLAQLLAPLGDVDVGTLFEPTEGVGLSGREDHLAEVAAWAKVAQAAPVAGGDAPLSTNELGRPVEAASLDDVFERLWQGDVALRDIAVQAGSATVGVDSVILDRRDVLLVFAQVSPARVSTPNPGPVFRVEVPLSDSQIAPFDDLFMTRSEVARNVVGELLFLMANVASVDSTSNSEGASTTTRIEVADPSFVDTMNELGADVFGDVEVVVADELIDGIDVVLRIGTGYLERKRQTEVAPVPLPPLGDDPGTVDADG